jgi:hypothetical protein
MGNHDDDGSHSSTYADDYLINFGPSVFAGQPWYTGSSPSGGGNFQLLQHEGRKIGFINFSIDQPQGEIDWANGIISSNPDTLFILGTHRYLADFKLISGRYGETVNSVLGPFTIPSDESPVPPASLEPNTAQALFTEVVAANQNVLMIQAGHFHSEWTRVADPFGVQQAAIEILTDYQDARNGGDGWMRIYSLDFDNGTLEWDTYSPTLNEHRSTLHHFVETIQQAYTQRDLVKALLGLPNDAAYFAFLNANVKNNPFVPDNFLTMHPDWDAAYFNGYLSDLFNGNVPAGFGNILEWENLWLLGFAANPLNPIDFRDGPRSPSGSLQIDFSAFAAPVPVPGAVWLLSSALAGMVGWSRRRA